MTLFLSVLQQKKQNFLIIRSKFLAKNLLSISFLIKKYFQLILDSLKIFKITAGTKQVHLMLYKFAYFPDHNVEIIFFNILSSRKGHSISCNGKRMGNNGNAIIKQEKSFEEIANISDFGYCLRVIWKILQW